VALLFDIAMYRYRLHCFGHCYCREKLKDFNTLEQVVAKIKEAKNIIGGHCCTAFEEFNYDFHSVF
jgi:hypothetical protein